MNRLISLLLRVVLILSTVAALLFTVRIILQQALNIGRWYWGGALVVFLAPVVFIVAINLFERGQLGVDRNA